MWPDEQFSNVWKPWEKSKSMENGYHTNWTIDKWKIEKPFVKCCFNSSKGNLFCIELSRGTKNGFISRTLKVLNWEILSHPPYFTDLAPSDYHLFASMRHSLAEQRFANFEEIEKWLVEWFALNEKKYFWNGINNLPETWAKCVESNGQYFE